MEDIMKEIMEDIMIEIMEDNDRNYQSNKRNDFIIKI